VAQCGENGPWRQASVPGVDQLAAWRSCGFGGYWLGQDWRSMNSLTKSAVSCSSLKSEATATSGDSGSSSRAPCALPERSFQTLQLPKEAPLSGRGPLL